MGAYALVTNQAALLDVAIVLALLVFLGTVAFAYYIERGVILTKAPNKTNHISQEREAFRGNR